MELEYEIVKRIDRSNGNNKTAAVVTVAARNILGGDRNDKMTATAASQA